MSEENICILNTDNDSAHFFDQAVEFTKKVMPQGIVTDEMLDNLRAAGVLLPGSLLAKLIKQTEPGQYAFIPRQKSELYELPEWQALDAKIQKKIMTNLWRPSHLAELAAKEIYQHYDLAELIYANISRLIFQRRIIFKTDGKTLVPPQIGKTQKKDDHLPFLSAMELIDKAYQNHRRAVLQGLFFVEISGLCNAVNLLMTIARNMPMRDLEIFTAESVPELQKQFAMESCRLGACRILIQNIVDPKGPITDFLADHCRRLDPKVFCYKYGRRQTMDLWSLHCMLETISFEQILPIMAMGDGPQQLTAILMTYQENLAALIPQKLRQMLGDALIAKLEPGNLAVLIQAMKEEADFLIAMEQFPKNHRDGFFKSLLTKLGLSPGQEATISSCQRILVAKTVEGLGREILAKLTPDKLQFVLTINDKTLTTALRYGFGYILPHIKIEKIMPLARIYNTPLWDIVKALRFVNQLDNMILEKIEYLADQNLLDIDFARFLAKTFQNKLEKLRFYHLEEVNKNKEVILLFKEKFLELKQGVVRIVTRHINVIKQHQEHMHIFFTKSFEQLNVMFQDPYKVSHLLATIGEPNSRRKIIYD
ncbi:MAG: hypothetical protein OEY01_08065 [Desulfobulbaceae bacterium]|nr:hypothetical protein [Desulfobulbaceae bacterium]